MTYADQARWSELEATIKSQGERIAALEAAKSKPGPKPKERTDEPSTESQV